MDSCAKLGSDEVPGDHSSAGIPRDSNLIEYIRERMSSECHCAFPSSPERAMLVNLHTRFSVLDNLITAYFATAPAVEPSSQHMVHEKDAL